MSLITLNRKKPTFLGIGAQKCGTTWIYRILEDHPEVLVSTPKELDFFSYYYDFGYQWYRSFFKNLKDKKICGEISPSYFMDTSAPERAATYNPGFKIIAVLRDPVERAFSNHLHEIRIGHFKGDDLSFEAGLENNPMYIEQSFYCSWLKNWYAKLPKAQILVLFLEEIKQNPVTEARKIYNFLDIDPDHESTFLFHKANISYSEKIKGVEYVMKTLGRFGRRIGGSVLVEWIKNKRSINRLRQANLEHLSTSVPEIKASTKEMLFDKFANDTINLAKLLKRKNLPWETWYRIKENR